MFGLLDTRTRGVCWARRWSFAYLVIVDLVCAQFLFLFLCGSGSMAAL